MSRKGTGIMAEKGDRCSGALVGTQSADVLFTPIWPPILLDVHPEMFARFLKYR